MSAKTVALAGNAFVTTASAGASEIINDNGLANWNSANTVTSVYFRMSSAASATVSLNAYLAGSNNSVIKVTVNGSAFTVKLAGTNAKAYAVGTVQVAAPGYVKVDLQGISKDGGYFGDVSSLGVTTTSALEYANDSANYYWSRRGPSVHLNYNVPSNSEYFYNEVTVPAGQDAIGSYFMVAGFLGGYCGIQVNSDTERRVLFSVWDADDGQKTTLVSKGAGVVDNGFGGEGTGGQSYLVFKWLAGNTYKVITRIRPDGAGSTLYSAWFFAPESNAWRYLATWKRPATTAYQSGVHSFLENFIDRNGYLGRRALYGNQWARNVSGAWSESTTARFTGDATATNAQRKDYAGGLENGQFYLRNGGFFPDFVTLNQTFTRPATGKQPSVDVDTLPTK
ncbi:nematoblast specific protein [Cylindrobasidium torrendii FP15055 ss-10]|uniref:Nematoblast specific protein n=1 Tax=Cylindrobasidium torrendii FP15055 ss-10 TaxID=1314674 RepID=A0A0D7BGD1_9AGAR|nr:nematoblast specific protein [Cylindrobasidium torrendii FP15055 ss-10]